MKRLMVGSKVDENQFNQTLQFYAKLFFSNFQADSRDQLSNMVSSAISFGEYFDNCESEISLLNRVYSDPMKVVVLKFGNNFSPKRKRRLMQGKSLSGLEWIFYRDTRFKSPLKKQYYVDEAKPMSKYMTLGDIIDIRGYLKIIIGSCFTSMVKKNDVPLDPLLLPDIDNKPLVQMGE
jgi:hypothetical protein